MILNAINREEKDAMMMKMGGGLGPKLLHPVHRVPLLNNTAWDFNNVTINHVDVSSWEESEKFCMVLNNVLTKEECQQLIDCSEHKGYQPALVNIGRGKQKFMPDIRNNDRCIYDDPALMEQIWQRILKALSEKDKTAAMSLLDAPWAQKKFQTRTNHTNKVFHAVGLNERMRFLRYDPGTYFASHYDGSYVRECEGGMDRVGERSFVTFQLYLNEGFEGGATRFRPIYLDEEEDDYDVEDETCTSFTFARSKNRSTCATPSASAPTGVDVIPRTGSVLLFQHDCCHQGSRVRSGRKYAIRSDVMYTTKGTGLQYANKPIIARQLLEDLY